MHDTGSSTHEGWGPTGKIGPHEVERLLDPQGGRAAKVAVSIPSPFARMHLVETALRFVGQGGGTRIRCTTTRQPFLGRVGNGVQLPPAQAGQPAPPNPGLA
ncbi:hypothetical protein ACFQT0_09340 [Hymenobacter humi]|uniref:Uncharacterized protein n=1 Tax=Hymenobacter humi TaxID=1411620 RepID=A0ABW2U5C0_9BACT